ncbi:energy-coupling factor ABC transporter ATP-binding protein [Bacillus pinisoli]|uniref:energy-coupling factor ABC transporter ATP-binding protein n=1 Tax=Bacillus pinisoli TaxID=2901866 RepID=UPI001FF62EEB|nr:energy-coupling factor ABC transporter ATP-binding protein [Bacillus pinisoli]
MDIKIEHLTHFYQEKTPFERLALHDISLEIQAGSFLTIIGHTGSGKSTIIQHLNGLLKPSSGTVTVGSHTITSTKKEKDLKSLRKKVGMVFQFPENQLFEETVEKDICFGPMNFGVPEELAKRKAKEALHLVGLDSTYLERSPFDLSGGQMRRVAIAGVLAMNPDVLVLDEPTAGLDPRGRKDMMTLFSTLHHEKNLTTIMITHNMEDAAAYSDEIIVMEKGTLLMRGKPEDIFSQREKLSQIGLDIPITYQFIEKVEKVTGYKLEGSFLTIDELVEGLHHFLSKESMR